MDCSIPNAVWHPCLNDFGIGLCKKPGARFACGVGSLPAPHRFVRETRSACSINSPWRAAGLAVAVLCRECGHGFVMCIAFLCEYHAVRVAQRTRLRAQRSRSCPQRIPKRDLTPAKVLFFGPVSGALPLPLGMYARSQKVVITPCAALLHARDEWSENKQRRIH